MIALDAMGGDFAPDVTVNGAISAAKQGVPVQLYGDESLLLPLLDKACKSWRLLPLSFFHCSQAIGMAEEPTKSVLKKKDSSLMRAIQAVADGDADAVVSAGNSGAVLVGSTLIIGRLPGVMRPALGNFLPTNNGSIFCIDLGANTDCKPEFLEQFALMGHVYVQHMTGIASPRVGLLSNGAEPYKGSQSVKQTYNLLERNSQVNFIGNVEARDIFDGQADVLVCDGFVGNIMLKTAQGTLAAMTSWIKEESARSWWRLLFFASGAGIFKHLKQKTDYESRGGALLLGLKKPCIVAHGCSTARAIEKALMFAHSLVQEKRMQAINEQLTRHINATALLTQSYGYQVPQSQSSQLQ